MNIPKWLDFFMGLAFIYSRRSKDAQTQHGCVIADANHNFISAGYNSFIRNIDDSVLPRTRPAKYPWMRHAERNAVDNALINLSLVEEPTAFISGKPCLDCAQHLYQNHVHKWYIIKREGSKLEAAEAEDFKLFLKLTGVDITYVNPQLHWLDIAVECIPKKWKNDIRSLVMASGGFDPLHKGHLAYLETASKLGRLLVVVNGDRFLIRKKGYVFMMADERLAIIKALRYVDEAVIWNDDTQFVHEAILEYKPDIFVNGGDTNLLSDVPKEEQDACKRVNCKIILGVGGTDKLQSSSDLIKLSNPYV